MVFQRALGWWFLPRGDGTRGQSHVVQVLGSPAESVRVLLVVPGQSRHLGVRELKFNYITPEELVYFAQYTVEEGI